MAFYGTAVVRFCSAAERNHQDNFGRRKHEEIGKRRLIEEQTLRFPLLRGAQGRVFCGGPRYPQASKYYDKSQEVI